MPTEDFIIHLFCKVDDALGARPKHPQERLTRSELVTLGMLCSLKGVSQRAFYRWVSNNFRHLFPTLPERTRLFRRLVTHWEETTVLLAEPTLLGVIDTYGFETIHPYRDGRTAEQIGRKGFSNHRWIVGGKLVFVLDRVGRVVGWSVMPGNVSDNTFLFAVHAFEQEMLIFGDSGFHSTTDKPPNLRICKRGVWNDRMLVETVLSMLTTVMHTKKLLERTWPHVVARLAYLFGVFNILLEWDGLRANASGFIPISVADFSL
jgi:hypothetical protein